YLFFFNDTATTEIYPLSLHDALPISRTPARHPFPRVCASSASGALRWRCRDRKSTRLNSSHPSISDAVFCLKKRGLRFRSNSKKPSARIPLCQNPRLLAANHVGVARLLLQDLFFLMLSGPPISPLFP